MATMKTPGVYVTEKSAFPNSVVQVATGVPAFIGYTEKAANGTVSLHGVAWRITSMAEFEMCFGGPPKPLFSFKQWDGKTAGDGMLPELTVLGQRFYHQGPAFMLYQAMRLFFDNGGGDCWIVSVGDYSATEITYDALVAGLQPLEVEREPSMVVIPEAVRLETSDGMALNVALLRHCGETMKNRFAIMDIPRGFLPASGDADPVKAFRDGIGEDTYSFGAAYYPWLQTSIVDEDEFSFDMIVREDWPAFAKGVSDFLQDTSLRKIERAFAQTYAITRNGRQYVVDLGQLLRPVVSGSADMAASRAEIASEFGAKGNLRVPGKGMWMLEREMNLLIFDPNEDFSGEVSIQMRGEAIGSDGAKYTREFEVWAGLPPMTYDAFCGAMKSVAGEYRETIKPISSWLNIAPVAAAMAGIYAAVDGARGVWKAPTGISVASVKAPMVRISATEQEDLGLSATGSSINSIRFFMGEGTLVWGARTLDGHSRGWGHISVRRTMIMIEESIRLALEPYVFEPNNANTWATLRATIESFLTNLWKQGGLAGAKLSEAFSVQVGLDETMTESDVLDAMLCVTVLVAVQRPAEFIEITLQQKMQEVGP